MRRLFRRTITVALLLCLSSAGAGRSHAATSGEGAGPDRTEPTLAEVLESLRDQGLNVVYSSALVKPRYRVSSPPPAELPLEDRARALLVPFGLDLEHVPPDTWYVVRTDPGRTDSRPPAAAATDIAKPVVEQVLVTSSRYRLVRETHERERLEQQELRSIPSLGRDLLRAINQLAGQASSGVSARNHFRGGNTDEVLYLIDGVTIIEPFHMGDFQALFSTVNPGLVDAIDVYSAGFPVRYGSRLSGVVDMELRPADRPFAGTVDINLLSAAAHLQGYHERLEWLVSARRSVIDLVMGGLENDYGKPRFHDEMVRLAWEGDAASVAVGVLSSNDELTLSDDSAGEDASADYHHLATWFRGELIAAEDVALSLTAAYTRVRNERDGTLNDPLDAVGFLQEERQFEVVNVSPTLSWRIAPNWLLRTGLEGQFQDGEFDVLMAARYGPLAAPIQSDPTLRREVTAKRDGTLLTGFVSLQQTIGDHLEMEYGLRYDLQDIDPIHDNQLSPRLQINYRPRPDLELFANLGRYTQHQNLYELQLDDGLLELSPPQIADQISIGADWIPRPSLELRIEAYQRSVDDPRPRFENLYNPWVLLPELHADRVGLTPDEARSRGIELTVRYRIQDEFSVSFGYTEALAEERLQGNWRSRPWEQQHAARLTFDWRPGSWQISAHGSWHSGWPNTSLLTEPPTSTRRLYDQRLPDYFSLDLHVSRTVPLARSELEIYLDLTNATMRENVGGYRYELSGGTPAPEERKLLPAIPALGLAWRW